MEEIQFKTGDDWQERYTAGQIVALDRGLKAGRVYEGVGSILCEACIAEWAPAAHEAHCESLAELLDSGRLVAKARDGTLLEGRQVRQWIPLKVKGWSQTPDDPSLPRHCVELGGVMDQFEVRWKGLRFPARQEIEAYYKLYFDLLGEMERRQADWFERNDWGAEFADPIREDFEVTVDDCRRLIVRRGSHEFDQGA